MREPLSWTITCSHCYAKQGSDVLEDVTGKTCFNDGEVMSEPVENPRRRTLYEVYCRWCDTWYERGLLKSYRLDNGHDCGCGGKE